MALQLTKRRFTVAQYHQIAKAGVLTEDDRVELIDGEIVEMSPIDWRHHRCVMRLDRLLTAAFGPTFLVSVQGPLHLDDLTEVQPDIVVLRNRPDEYRVDEPKIEDVLLVVEVGDSTAHFDRETKARLYARGGIPDFWLANLEDDEIHVFREPTSEGYRAIRTERRGARVTALALPDHPIAVDDILG